MHNSRLHFQLSPIPLCFGAVGVLLVSYIGLIAVVMSYAAMTVEFSQSVRNDEATLATLESRYLDSVTNITNTNYLADGYEKPVAKVFVRARSATTLR